MGGGEQVELAGVPETLLWNLYHRALEARRPDAVLADPLAIELVDALDYPFAERFGPPGRARALLAQAQALRARAFDGEVRRHLADRPEATVVALGEGLETQFWRVGDGRPRWVSVDLPEVIALRERLLPADPRLRPLAASVLDEAWMTEIDPSTRPLITAQGLLMYFQPRQVRDLLVACARRFPGSTMVFDTVPRAFSARTLRAAADRPASAPGNPTVPADGSGYRPPPMPWGMDPGEIDRLAASTPGVATARRVRLPRGRGPLFGYLAPGLARVPGVPSGRLNPFAPWTIVRAEFSADPAVPG